MASLTKEEIQRLKESHKQEFRVRLRVFVFNIKLLSHEAKVYICVIILYFYKVTTALDANVVAI